MVSEQSTESEAVNPALPTGSGHAFLMYTLARLGLLVAVGALLFAVGARGWLLVVLAFLISGLLSFVLLGRMRDSVSVWYSNRVERSREKRAAKTHAEDDLL